MTKNNSNEWYNPWLIAVLVLFVLGTLTGFHLFFLAPFINGAGNFAGYLHTVLGLILIPIYIIFQIQHYNKKKQFRGTMTYRLGLASFFFTLLLTLTGIVLIPEFLLLNQIYFQLTELIHAILSFVWIILITSHLALVYSKFQKSLPK